MWWQERREVTLRMEERKSSSAEAGDTCFGTSRHFLTASMVRYGTGYLRRL